jgi:hypothetical protein
MYNEIFEFNILKYSSTNRMRYNTMRYNSSTNTARYDRENGNVNRETKSSRMWDKGKITIIWDKQRKNCYNMGQRKIMGQKKKEKLL